jgi:hypothetical protein
MNHTELFNKLIAHLKNGGYVQITTYLKSTVYSPKHVNMFKLGSDQHIYVQRGKHWDNVSYSSIRGLRKQTD